MWWAYGATWAQRREESLLELSEDALSRHQANGDLEAVEQARVNVETRRWLNQGPRSW